MDQIRIAERLDVPRLIELGFEFAVLSFPIHKFEVSLLKITEFINDVIDDPNAVVLVLVVEDAIQGFIVGTIQKIYFSENVAMQEMAWYVKPGFKGLSLLKAFENWARMIGCHKLIVGNKPGYYDLSRIYTRCGFTLLENQYTKTLD